MTPAQFKQKWESPENNITFDDVAECAREWGLYRTPRTVQIDQVLYRVLCHAGVKDKEDYKPSPDETLSNFELGK